jgi:hypothetical protein
VRAQRCDIVADAEQEIARHCRSRRLAPARHSAAQRRRFGQAGQCAKSSRVAAVLAILRKHGEG